MLPDDVIQKHARGVQHGEHHDQRLLDQPRRADRAVHRARQLRGLYPGQGGDCAPRSVMMLRRGSSASTSARQALRHVGGSTNIEVRFDMLNVFDTPNFTPVGATGTNRRPDPATIFR
jgi:hypothetical protein